jgi:hypothetical protein
MSRFAVYYVPPAESPFYQLGSAILGYDVRAGQRISAPPWWAEEDLKGWDEDWVRLAAPYGFHCTLGDTIDFHSHELAAIEWELEELWDCLNPDNPLTLWRKEDEPVRIPHGGEGPVTLRYVPNQALIAFTTLVVARINPSGIGSGYVQNLERFPNAFADRPHRAHRIQKFYSPTILDDWRPHFTLLNPYNGGDPDQVCDRLGARFAEFQELEIRSVCLLVQDEDHEDWRIHCELHR